MVMTMHNLHLFHYQLQVVKRQITFQTTRMKKIQALIPKASTATVHRNFALKTNNFLHKLKINRT